MKRGEGVRWGGVGGEVRQRKDSEHKRAGSA